MSKRNQSKTAPAGKHSRNTPKQSTKPVTAKRMRGRDISRPVEKLLWARAAGRCECAGCNASLWKSEVSQESVPVGQNAHIYAFSKGGARGNNGIAGDKIHDPSNLILVCYPCHRRIDKDKNGTRYSVEVLRRWKREHEERIERVTAIASSLKSHVVFYGANTGAQLVHWQFNEVTAALFPARYPAEDRAIQLALSNSATRDDSTRFWDLELENLRATFDLRVRSRIGTVDGGGINHVSIFALAPQPLLVALGGLLGDIVAGDVFQRRREPPGWTFAENDDLGWPDLIVEEPDDLAGEPVLVISLSGSIVNDRVHSVLGESTTIWRITVPTPNNDVVQRRSQLLSFRCTIRRLLDRVKRAHGQEATLHIFPAMPASTAVELGRIRMPKAEMRWRLYDQHPGLGFLPAIDMIGDRAVASGGGL